MPVREGTRQDPEDCGRRAPGHRLRGGLPGPLQQRPLPLPQLRLQRYRGQRVPPIPPLSCHPNTGNKIGLKNQ